MRHSLNGWQALAVAMLAGLVVCFGVLLLDGPDLLATLLTGTVVAGVLGWAETKRRTR